MKKGLLALGTAVLHRVQRRREPEMSPGREALRLDGRRRELVTRCPLLKHPNERPPSSQWLPVTRITLTAFVCALALIAVGCGSKDPKSNAPSPARIKAAFAGSPPKLQALHDQAGQLLSGGKDAFHSRLDQLRGYPVVVNSWGSWCAPCRGEFPVFQQTAVKEGKQVAFLGLDAQDNDGNARKFLKEYPVTYPSYKDPDVKISNSIRAGGFFPTTIFFNKQGKLVYAHPGPYNNQKDLIADIHRYAG